MKYIAILIIIIASVIACDNSKPEPQPKQEKPKQHQPECATDFHEFFKNFSKDSVFQKSRLDAKLQLLQIDPYDGSINAQNIRDKWSYVDFEDYSSAQTDAYKFVSRPKKDSVFLVQQGIDNGIHIEYIFARKDNCWYLVLIKDESD